MLQPLFNRIIVKLEDKARDVIFENGIILPASISPQKVLHTEGIVQSVGSGGVTKKGVTLPMTVQEGDRVILEPKHGSTVSICGQEYIIIPEENIVAVVER